MLFVFNTGEDVSGGCLNNDAEYVVRLYSDMVYRIALSHLKNTHDAEDAYQETFLTYFKKNKRFDDEEYRKAWLIRVALNCCKRISSYNGKHGDLPLDECVLSYPFESQNERTVYNAIISLPQIYKTVIFLHYFENLSAKQIARILRVNESTVFMRLSRGRMMLKEKLEGNIV